MKKLFQNYGNGRRITMMNAQKNGKIPTMHESGNGVFGKNPVVHHDAYPGKSVYLLFGIVHDYDYDCEQTIPSVKAENGASDKIALCWK